MQKLNDMSTTLKEKIVGDMRNAMKSGDTTTRDVLRVLMADIDRGQFTKDEDITPIIKKTIDNIKLTGAENFESEVNVLEPYMPTQLNEEELGKIVRSVMSTNDYNSMKDMGLIMSFISTTYPNQYDGKILSNIVKSELSK